MIVLDACVLIAHLDGRDAHHERARRLLTEHVDEALGASPISLAETLVAPAREGVLVEARDALERLGVGELPLGADAHLRLADLRTATGCRMPDCCVLLAAKERGGVVASFDLGLTKAAANLGLLTIT